MLQNETNSTLLYLNLAFANPFLTTGSQEAVRDRMLLYVYAASLPRLHPLSSKGSFQKMEGRAGWGLMLKLFVLLLSGGFRFLFQNQVRTSRRREEELQ